MILLIFILKYTTNPNPDCVHLKNHSSGLYAPEKAFFIHTLI